MLPGNNGSQSSLELLQDLTSDEKLRELFLSAWWFRRELSLKSNEAELGIKTLDFQVLLKSAAENYQALMQEFASYEQSLVQAQAQAGIRKQQITGEIEEAARRQQAEIEENCSSQKTHCRHRAQESFAAIAVTCFIAPGMNTLLTVQFGAGSMSAAMISGGVTGTISSLLTREDPLKGGLEGALISGIGNGVGNFIGNKSPIFQNMMVQGSQSLASSLLHGGDIGRNLILSMSSSVLSDVITKGLPKNVNDKFQATGLLQNDKNALLDVCARGTINAFVLNSNAGDSFSGALAGLMIAHVAGMLGGSISQAIINHNKHNNHKNNSIVNGSKNSNSNSNINSINVGSNSDSRMGSQDINNRNISADSLKNGTQKVQNLAAVPTLKNSAKQIEVKSPSKIINSKQVDSKQINSKQADSKQVYSKRVDSKRVDALDLADMNDIKNTKNVKDISHVKNIKNVRDVESGKDIKKKSWAWTILDSIITPTYALDTVDALEKTNIEGNPIKGNDITGNSSTLKINVEGVTIDKNGTIIIEIKDSRPKLEIKGYNSKKDPSYKQHSISNTYEKSNASNIHEKSNVSNMHENSPELSFELSSKLSSKQPLLFSKYDLSSQPKNPVTFLYDCKTGINKTDSYTDSFGKKINDYFSATTEIYAENNSNAKSYPSSISSLAREGNSFNADIFNPEILNAEIFNPEIFSNSKSTLSVFGSAIKGDEQAKMEMRRRAPSCLVDFSDAIDPNLMRRENDGLVMSELKMYGRSGKNARDHMMHLITKPHEVVKDTFVLGADLTDAGLHHTFGTEYHPGSKFRNETRIDGIKELWNSDGLTKREAILTFALDAMILGRVAPKLTTVNDGIAHGITKVHDVTVSATKKSIKYTQDFISKNDIKPPITFQFENAKLYSGFPFDGIKFQNPIQKTKQFDKYINEVNFSSEDKLIAHFEKHGSNFKGAYQSPQEYLDGAKMVVNHGVQVEYRYIARDLGIEETRIGYVKFMGNTQRRSINEIMNNIPKKGNHPEGTMKFEFVGTNNFGNITTYHIENGPDLFKLLNDCKLNQTITPKVKSK